MSIAQEKGLALFHALHKEHGMPIASIILIYALKAWFEHSGLHFSRETFIANVQHMLESVIND